MHAQYGHSPLVDWDDRQRRVVEADVSDNLLVDAGPGTGKTAVACGRVAHLISHEGVPGSSILLFSFTRTAVAEIRDRIFRLAEEQREASGAYVRTLDSTAWRLRYAYEHGEAEKLFSDANYDRNIEDATAMLDDPPDELLDYLERFRHVIVDEAQDLTAVRARFVLKLIQRLEPECGVTVFADPAQAIYGFTDDNKDKAGGGAANLLEMINRDSPRDFERVELTELHRTDVKSLKTIFSDTRKIVLNGETPSIDRIEELGTTIRHLADGQVNDLAKQIKEQDNTLVLFRRRFDVVMQSSFLSAEGLQHRLRMSGLPVCIHPWVGHLLGKADQATLTRSDFDALWKRQFRVSLFDGLEPDAGWTLLMRFGSDDRGRLDVRRIRSTLARSRPPLEFCMPDCGWRGPIIGTIHASKGREADNVVLMLPRSQREAKDEKDDGLDEEVRVLYVGTTRPRQTLLVGDGFKKGGASLENGRVFRGRTLKKGTPGAQVEIGLEGDIDELSFVADPGGETCQRAVLRLADEVHNGGTPRLEAQADREDGFAYKLYRIDDSNQAVIGAFAQHVNYDLFAVGKAIGSFLNRKNLRPSETIRHLYAVGLRTVAFGEDDPRVDELPDRRRLSGMFVVPVVRGFSQMAFLSMKRRRQ